MSIKKFFLPSKTISLLRFGLCLILYVHVTTALEDQSVPGKGHLVKRNERQSIISAEFGEVSGVSVSDGNETFPLQFITLEPNSLFLPVMLHQDMVLYVHTGSGMLSYKDEYTRENISLRRGDVYRLESGTVFFIQSDLDPERQKLRIYAIFGNAGEDLREPTAYGPYSSIRELVLGFDKKILQETFKVPEEVIEEITSGTKPEAIVHGLPSSTRKTIWEREYEFIDGILGSRSAYSIFGTRNKDKKKSKLFNIFHEKPDFENCNGWSTTVTKKKNSALKNSKYGLFVVNLTHGGMMGPHWNPKATEIAIVLHGKGMVRVVCPSLPNQTECRNARFGVEEGDVFVVPRFHPMAQMAFNDATFVFMGFSTSTKYNHPQYLAGRASVLRTLDKHILATSFGVNDTTFDKLLNRQGESVILECTSCAEEEWRIMEEEIEKEREEARQREEEEARRREEERRRQEEEAKKREEEEAKRREEEKRKREQEEEEVARRKREEEEAQKRREQEEREREEWEKQQQEEEARKRREQEESEARQREDEKAQKREQEEREREEWEKQQQEEEARKRREKEESEARQREEEEAQKRREQEESEARQREEEEARKRREQEESEARQEERKREEWEKQQQEEARKRMEQEEREARQREEEEAQKRREQEEREQEQARKEEREREAAKRQEGGQGGEGGGQQEEGRGEQPLEEEGRRKGEAQREEEAAKQQEEEIGQEQEQGSGQGWGRRILKKTS